MKNEKNYAEDLIYNIIKKYTNSDGYIVAERYDEEQNCYYITDEIAEVLNDKGIKHCISEEHGIDISGFSEDFYSIAWIEDDNIYQYTFVCEYH